MTKVNSYVFLFFPHHGYSALSVLFMLVPHISKSCSESHGEMPKNYYRDIDNVDVLPFRNTNLNLKTRVDDLVSRLTLEEVVNQTIASYQYPTPAISRLGIGPFIWITECLHGQVTVNGTSFPQAIGLAASFSTKLIKQISTAISRELRARWNHNKSQGKYKKYEGLNCLTPVINILRDPRWGRNQETYGEDPWLAGQLAASFVKGLHGEHHRVRRASSGCKHFNVHGGPENIPVNRMTFNAQVKLKDWHETFLPAFEECVKAETDSLMCSYNSINGIPACANRQLLTDIARNGWKFDGFVISDDDAIRNIKVDHNFTKTWEETAAVAIKAGTNLELTGHTAVYGYQLSALKMGLIGEQELRENVKPLFRTRMRLGEFDPPETNPFAKLSMNIIQSNNHRRLAEQAAEMSFVLLKNSNMFLPIQKFFRRTAVLGPFANEKSQIFGDYSSIVHDELISTVWSGLRQFPTFSEQFVLSAGCSDSNCSSYDRKSILKALDGSDMIVLCIGTGQAIESEDHDRRNLQLPGKQGDLVNDVLSSTIPTIVLIFSGGSLDVAKLFYHDSVKAVLACHFPAQSTGSAIRNVLTGVAAPAGRLPATWAQSLDNVPPITDYTMVNRTYRFGMSALFPFGYGLSYSKFHYDKLSVPANVSLGQRISVDVSLQNVGRRESAEVVQLYLTDTIRIPYLVAFKRINLLPGERKDLEMVIKRKQVARWKGEKLGFQVIPGKYLLYAGGQQPNQKLKVPSNVIQKSFIINDI